MQRKHWAIAVVVAAALAALVTFQLKQRRETKKARASAEVVTTSASAPTPATAAAPPHDHGHHQRETPVDEPELRSGQLRVFVVEEPRGKARLAGRVVDEAGAPVVGAVVTVATQPPRRARSGRDGAFVFADLLPRRYAVTARAPGGVAGPLFASAAESKAAAAAPMLVKLRPGGQVNVEVVDAQQQPISGATVELRGLEQLTAPAAAGRAELAAVVPGAYQVAAWADGYARTFLPAVVGAGQTSLRLELARGVPVSGRVTDAQGAPVAGAHVRYEASAGPIAGSDLLRDAVTTDARGAFAFAALPAGSFRFVATHAAHATEASSLVTLDGSAAHRDVEIALPPGATVRGKVVSKSGAPAPFAQVRMGITVPGARLIVPSTEVTADAAGAFTLTGLPRRSLTALAVHDDGASSAQTIDAQAGEVSGVTLTLDADLAITGAVVDAAGQPVAGAQVSAFPEALGRRSAAASGAVVAASADAAAADAASAARSAELAQWQLRGFPRAITDTAGAFSLTGLPPGSYRLRASRGEGASAARGDAADVAALAGAGAARLTLPAEGAVRGKVAFEDGSAPAQLTVAVGLAQHGFRDGELRLDGLTPQTYQLVVRGESFATRMIEVKVEGGKTAELGTVVVRQREPSPAQP